MFEWGDDLKKRLNESKNPDQPKKLDLESIESSINAANQNLSKNQKKLDEISDQRKKILEKISHKILSIKSETEKANLLISENNFHNALVSLNKILELDPENIDAKNNIITCNDKIKIQNELSQQSTTTGELTTSSSELLESKILPIETSELNETPRPTATTNNDTDVKIPENSQLNQSELDAMLSGITIISEPPTTTPEPEPIIAKDADVTNLDNSQLNQSELDAMLSGITIISEPPTTTPEPEPIIAKDATVKIPENTHLNQAELDVMLSGMLNITASNTITPELESTISNDTDVTNRENTHLNQAELDAMLSGITNISESPAATPEPEPTMVNDADIKIPENIQLNQSDLDAELSGIPNISAPPTTTPEPEPTMVNDADIKIPENIQLNQSDLDAMLSGIPNISAPPTTTPEPEPTMVNDADIKIPENIQLNQSDLDAMLSGIPNISAPPTTTPEPEPTMVNDADIKIPENIQLNQSDLDSMLSGIPNITEPPTTTPEPEPTMVNDADIKIPENIQLNQSDLDSMLSGIPNITEPPTTTPEPEPTMVNDADIKIPENIQLNQSDLDAMLSGMPNITEPLATNPEPEINSSDDITMSPDELNSLLNNSSNSDIPPGNIDKQSEIMSQSDLDKLLQSDYTQVKQENSLDANSNKLDDLNNTKNEVSYILKVTDEQISNLNKGLESLYPVKYPDLIPDDTLTLTNSNETNELTPEEMHEPILTHEDQSIESETKVSETVTDENTIMQEMAKSENIDLSEVDKLGDTIALQADMLLDKNKQTDSKNINNLQQSTSQTEIQDTILNSEKTQLLTKIQNPQEQINIPEKIIKSSKNFLNFNLIFLIFNILIITSVIFFVIRPQTHKATAAKEEKTDNVHESNGEIEQKIEPIYEKKLKEAKKILNTGKNKEGFDVLFSISKDFPQTSTIFENLMKAADIMYDNLPNIENPTNDDYRKIAQLYEIVIEQFPTNPKTANAYFRSAECYYQSLRYDKAGEYYEFITENFKESEIYEHSLLKCGKIQLAQDKYKEARVVFLKIIKEFPDSPAAKMSQLDIAKTYQLEAMHIKNEFNIKD